jgi:hypothetical protein
VVQHPRSRIHILPSARDRKDGITNAYVANRHWMRETALKLGKERLYGLILSEGKTGDDSGATSEMQRYLQDQGIEFRLLPL